MGRPGIAASALGAAIGVVLGAAVGAVVVRWDARAEAAPTTRTVSPAADGTVEQLPSPRPASREREPEPRIDRACGARGARIVRFRVSVERGLPATRRAFARDLATILCDERSWVRSGRVRFRYDPGAPLLIGLRSASATERRCLALIGLSVRERFSCASAREVVLNADRWFGGSPWWPGSVARYRRLLVNHEVGHVLGHGHRGCDGDGRAPVMMQQSKGVGTCRPNPWPLPAELRATR